MEAGPSEEETLALHREVLREVRHQPLSASKKVRLVRRAKDYIRRHEGAIEERLATSNRTWDVLMRWRLLFFRVNGKEIQSACVHFNFLDNFFFVHKESANGIKSNYL